MTLLHRLTACLLALALAACAAPDPLQSCTANAPWGNGWTASFVAGCRDAHGQAVGGSQVIHLVPHKGKLYAANGYWEDAHNVWYGGSDPSTAWGQVLRLDGPDETWRVDANLGPQHLRTELLKSVVFTQGVNGRPLPQPDNVLLAATYNGSGQTGVNVFVRNDDTGTWTKSPLIPGNTGKRGEDNSVRAAAVYRDSITGREKIFVSVGVLGLFTGSYDQSLAGKIAWDAKPEPTAAAGAGTRILAIAQANHSLIYSEGSKIWRRIDGQQPRYELVLDLSAQIDARTSRAVFQSIGGIRGLTAIDGPVAGQQSLLFVWTDGGRSQACVHRLDPSPDGSWTDHQEVCLAQLASHHIGAPVAYALAAYSNFLPVSDPLSGERFHLIGCEAFIPGKRFESLTAHNQRNANGGFYAGAMYALRDGQGHWGIGEVGGKYAPGKPELVSVYTYALSPFGGTDPAGIYLGGYDPDHFPSTDTAWIASAPLARLFKPDGDGREGAASQSGGR